MYSVIFFKSGCYMDYEKYSYGTSTNILHIVNIFLEQILALAGVAQWIEHWPMNQRVSGSIPSQAHAWVAGQVPSLRHVRGNHTLMSLSLFFSLPSAL